MLIPMVRSIQYSKPDFTSIRDTGYYPVDMHLHTCYSDGISRIPDLISHAKKHHIGVAITDHNEIRGVIAATSGKNDIMVIPGIELETMEGPHILMYFYALGDLEDFFNIFNRERKSQQPGLMGKLTVLQSLILAESFDCLRIAAHPFGYYGINRGILKCVEKNMLPGILDHLDGIEVICGGMKESLNQRAINYAKDHIIPFTGGSDAHILSDVGSVITAAPADTVEDFLSGIRRRDNIVIGKPSGCIRKGATAGVIAWSFVPYTVSRMQAHYRVQKYRTTRFFSDYRGKIHLLKKPGKEKIEELKRLEEEK
jgi:predicted metal-dependent phosphoesterase TrpH